jgi:hypothetical protein
MKEINFAHVIKTKIGNEDLNRIQKYYRNTFTSI